MTTVAPALAALSGLGAGVSAALFAVGLAHSAKASPLHNQRSELYGDASAGRSVAMLLAPLGSWVLQVFPAGFSARQSRRLAQADLDDTWTVSAWIGLLAWPWVIAGAVSVLCLAADRPRIAVPGLVVAAAVGALAEMVLRRHIADRERRFLKELPAYLDVLTVCVEAGASLSVALRMAVEKAAASPARKVFARLLHEIRMGRSRAEALNNVARLYELEALTSLVAALVQSEGHGMSLGAVLRAQSHQRATERQLRAEKAAMKAPVKMLGPLVLCIFPCTFVVIAVPVLVRLFLDGG